MGLDAMSPLATVDTVHAAVWLMTALRHDRRYYDVSGGFTFAERPDGLFDVLCTDPAAPPVRFTETVIEDDVPAEDVVARIGELTENVTVSERFHWQMVELDDRRARWRVSRYDFEVLP